MKKTLPRWAYLVLAIVILGTITGISSAFLAKFLDFFEEVFLGWSETNANPAPLVTPPLRRLFSLTIGGAIVAIIWYVLRQKTTLVTVKGAVSGKDMPVIGTIVHTLTQIFYVSTGGSVGREVAPRELGSLWSQMFMRFTKFNLTEDDRKLLVASAAGAGFAGVYLSPIAGSMFACEMLLQKLDRTTVATSLSMAAIATAVSGTIKGRAPYYLIGDQAFDVKIAGAILLIGPIMGIVGSIMKRVTAWAEGNKTTGKAILWQLPLMAIATGLVSYLGMPQISGNGRALAQFGLDAASGALSLVPFLLLGALLKFGVTLLTLRAGASGGVIAPAIAIGSALGAAILLLLEPLVNHGIPVWQGALIGATSLLATSQSAPLMAMFMMAEITHLNFSSIISLIFGVSLAYLVSQGVDRISKSQK